MMIRRLAAICVLFSLMASPAAANEATDSLHDMLSRVPADAIHGDGLVSYVDYRAVESARPGAAQPRSTEEWMALQEAGEAPFDLWLTDFVALASGSSRLRQAFVAGGEDWPSLLGFDFFDVDRELHFGNPPDDGLVLAGAFEPDAIASAHTARGFTSADGGNGVLLCGAGGCDEGHALNLDLREPADPFGGQLGQQQPLLVSGETLLSSASIDTVEAMGAASDSTGASLADDPAVRTTLGAIPDDALLRQLTLVPPQLLVPYVGSLVDDAVTAEELLLKLERFAPEPMPQYRLAMLADTATPDEQITYIVLAYDTEADARSAAAALPGRIEALDSIDERRPLRELFKDQGVTDIVAVVHVAPDGSGVATVLEMHAPLPSSDLIQDPAARSSLPYRLIVGMVLSGDVLWLAA